MFEQLIFATSMTLLAVLGIILLIVFALIQLVVMSQLASEGLHPTRNWRTFALPALGIVSAFLLMFGVFV